MENLKVTFKNAILAQCHQCMGHYADGMQDCKNVNCSLYSYMPYRTLEPDLTWTKYHPKRVGRILRSQIQTKTLSTEQKDRLAQRLKRARDAKQ